MLKEIWEPNKPLALIFNLIDREKSKVIPLCASCHKRHHFLDDELIKKRAIEDLYKDLQDLQDKDLFPDEQSKIRRKITNQKSILRKTTQNETYIHQKMIERGGCECVLKNCTAKMKDIKNRLNYSSYSWIPKEEGQHLP